MLVTVFFFHRDVVSHQAAALLEDSERATAAAKRVAFAKAARAAGEEDGACVDALNVQSVPIS